MTRRLSKRASTSFADRKPRSVKRRKLYSTRDIPWEEQRGLGKKFVEAGEGNWPVHKIVAERTSAGKLQYQIEWEPHPGTGEEFEPVWLHVSDVGSALKEEWKNGNRERQQGRAKDSAATTARKARARRIIPDSSGTTIEDTGPQSDAPLSPPSLGSDSSLSGPEIFETQEPSAHSPLKVKLPPLPTDKADYETWRNSQTSPSNPSFCSPDNRLVIATSQTQPLVSKSSHQSTSPSSRLGIGYVNNSQPRNSPSQIVETSPRGSSARSKPPSNLGRFVEAAGDTPGVGQTISSQGLQFLTQLPYPNDFLTSTPNTSQVSYQGKVTRRSGRLSSPFEETPSKEQFLEIADASVPRPLKRKARGKSPSSNDDSDIYCTPESTSNMADGADDVHLSSTLSTRSASALLDRMAYDEPSSNDQLRNPASDSNQDAFADPLVGPLTIHASIEEEPEPSTDSSQIMGSKGNSSQESLNSQREIETVDGIMIPVRPILGPNEFAISLPAEGKVKSAYDEVIALKRKAIERFIGRKGAPGLSDISSKKTIERHEMQEMISRLNDTVTHTDLGLPMAQTQYEISAEQNAAYAEYAGSKFVMLGYIIDQLKVHGLSIVVFAQGGSLLNLLEQYVKMKQVTTHRHDGAETNGSDYAEQGTTVHLFPTQVESMVSLPSRPSFMVAFDVSFTTSDQQVQHLRAQHGDDLPIIHFLVANTSEHVERCVPITLTSNIRLKVVVRTTYAAYPNIGGEISYIPHDSDQPVDGRQMDMGDLQRAVRKSPARKMSLIADVLVNLVQSGDFSGNWTLGGMPELKLEGIDTPSKVSRAASRTPQPRNVRTQTPVSRAATPSGRKRLLDVDGENGSKRQRLTPVRDTVPSSQAVSEELVNARSKIAQLTGELSAIRESLSDAERNLSDAELKAEDWKESHAGLLHRHEKNKIERKKLHKENKQLNAAIVAMKERDETARKEKEILKQQVADLKSELNQARNDLKAEGGDVAELEEARQEARTATARVLASEKSLTSTKNDFEFTRSQYQEASRQAVDLACEVKDLENQVEKFKHAAEDSKRSLKAMNYQNSLTKAMERANQFRLEVKNREAVIKKLQEENAALKSRRGVQTRGSSVQPASSPAPRSRQASPAAGTHLVPPSGSRASVLRHER